jgi:putative transposase
MSSKTSIPTIWHIPDDLWSLMAPILGPEKLPGTRGRNPTPFRLVFDAIVYVLRTGCQWHALPRQEYAPASTIHGVYRKWVKAGVFEQAWQVLLGYYDQQLGIDWKWQALDGAIIKAPLGGEATGKSPVDRSKSGTKRSLLCDRRGAPLSLVVTAANTHDKTVALETLDKIIVERPEKLIYRLHHLCLDKGYDYADVIAGVLAREYILHMKKRGQDDKPIDGAKKYPARRWVVERTHSWMNRFRRLLIRWEKKVENYEAMVHLACVLILYRLVVTATN